MRQVEGGRRRPSPAWPASTHASHTSFSTAARGFACKWRSLMGQVWGGVGEDPGGSEGKGSTRRWVVG